MNQLLKQWTEIGIVGALDIALMSFLVYGLFIWIQKTRRAGLTLGGISIIGAVYFFASVLGLKLTTLVLQTFFAILVIALVVIFQEELRQLFEYIAKWGLNRAFVRRTPQSDPLPRLEIETIAQTLLDLAQERIGALIVIAGQDPLTRHVDGGISLNGDVSEALLKSIFDPHSMGHDGAVLIVRGKIEKFGVRLPLTRNQEGLGSLGTRHAAALGLSERTDALCLVVSEERGTVRAAQNGQWLKADDRAHLLEVIGSRCDASQIEPARPLWRRIFINRYREKIASVGIATLLWFLLVYPTQIVDAYFTVTVQPSSPPANLSVTQLTPSGVEVRISGLRRHLERLAPGDIKLTLPFSELSSGYQLIPVAASMFHLPEGFQIIDFRPRQVFVVVQENPPDLEER